MSWLTDALDRWTLKKAYKWGRGIAKTKLLVFYTLQEAHPEKSDEEFYYLTLLNRTGYSEDIVREIVDRVENRFGVLQVELNLRNIIKSMIVHEEFKKFGLKGFPHPSGMSEAFRAVDETIPDDI